MTMKISILTASVNPTRYDTKMLRGLTYDQAVEFFDNDTIGCCSYHTYDVDLTQANEFRAWSEDDTDIMLVWVRAK